MTTLTIFVAYSLGCVVGTILPDWLRWHHARIPKPRNRGRYRRRKDE